MNDSNSLRQYDAGEVVDNERGCFNARCCFKVKNAAPKTMVFVLLFDLSMFIVVWTAIGLVIASSYRKASDMDGPY